MYPIQSSSFENTSSLSLSSDLRKAVVLSELSRKSFPNFYTPKSSHYYSTDFFTDPQTKTYSTKPTFTISRKELDLENSLASDESYIFEITSSNRNTIKAMYRLLKDRSQENIWDYLLNYLLDPNTPLQLPHVLSKGTYRLDSDTILLLNSL